MSKPSDYDGRGNEPPYSTEDDKLGHAQEENDQLREQLSAALAECERLRVHDATITEMFDVSQAEARIAIEQRTAALAECERLRDRVQQLEDDAATHAYLMQYAADNDARIKSESVRLRARVAELEGAVRDACPEWLPGMVALFRTQDNACTANPVFTVQQRRRHTGIDTQWTDDITWIDEGAECSPERSAELEAEYQRTGDEPQDCTRAGYVDEWEHVQSFFTDAAAKDYITANAHRMCDPRVYVESAYRNREWQQVVELLLRCAAARALLDGGEGER